MFAAAGCQSGDAGAVLGLGGDAKEQKAEEGKVLASELNAYCPRVLVKEEEGVINRYAKGGEGDAAKLSYQASIAESTRSCSRQTGTLAMKVAVAGRVVPGPAGASGTIALPIKVSVVRGDGEVQYSQTYNHQVALVGNQAQQFVFNDPNVVVPIPADDTLQVFAGFDVPRKKQEEEAF
jgi:hypothetical protein